MTSLTIADLHHLRAAEGWLELGSHLDANEELECITATERGAPTVLRLRFRVFAAAKKWEACLEIASALVVMIPDIWESWIQRSFALYELKRLDEAYDLLLPAATKFPVVALIPYNLARYCAQLGRIDESRAWLAKAFELGDPKQMKLNVLDDPDLEPLWRESPQ